MSSLALTERVMSEVVHAGAIKPQPPTVRLLVSLVLAAGLTGCTLFSPNHLHLQPQDPAAEPGGPVPARVKQRFEHAVSLMQSGNTEQAEVELRDVVLIAPQLAAPVVDLSILYRKEGKLEEAEELLRTSATAGGHAMVWTELGVTQRLRGEFRDAASSYERAIAADPKYAPAYRDLGVVSDLYLGDAQRALTAFERYKELTGEDKPVSNWIAELRIRTGQQPAKAAGGNAAGAPAAAAAEAPAAADAAGKPAAAASADPPAQPAADPPPKAKKAKGNNARKAQPAQTASDAPPKADAAAPN